MLSNYINYLNSVPYSFRNDTPSKLHFSSCSFLLYTQIYRFTLETLQFGRLVFYSIRSHLVFTHILAHLENKCLLDSTHPLEDTQPSLSPSSDHGFAIA
jgi:hypothetical protein